MRKLSILVVLLFGLSTPVLADTLQITGGGYSLDGSNPFFDVSGVITGPNSKITASHNNAWSPLGLATGEGTVFVLRTFGSSGTVINDIHYSPPPPTPPPFVDLPVNLHMVLLHAPISLDFPDPPLWIITDGPVREAFSMTGTLKVIDPATNNPVDFDLVGTGYVDVFWRETQSFPFIHADYIFTPQPVPESSSLVLLLIAIGPLAVVAVRKKEMAQP